MGPLDEGLGESVVDIVGLSSDGGDLVVQSDFLLLGQDESSEEVESPVHVLVEHPKGLLSVGIDGVDFH